MNSHYHLSLPPDTEPFDSADDIKAYLSVYHDLLDDEIMLLVAQARQYIEGALDVAFLTQTWDLYLNQWPSGSDPINLDIAPIQAVASITYTDTNGDSQTLSTSVYTVDVTRDPARVYLAYGQSWPAVRVMPKSIRVRMTAGWGAGGSDVPQLWLGVLKSVVADLINAREIYSSGVKFEPSPAIVRMMNLIRIRPMLGAV